MITFFLLVGIFIGCLEAVIYDVFSGKPVTKDKLQLYKQRINTQYCTIDVKPCDPEEWRRVDGTCLSLKFPSRGGFPGTHYNLLPTNFSIDYEPRNSSTSEPLPLARHLRCELLQEGRANDFEFTQLVSHYLQFAADDVISLHDVSNYVYNTTNCCAPEKKSNYACAPVKIPVHDPIHRFSGLSCQNLTRPQTLQYFGCLESGSPYVRISFITPTYDLSLVYGHTRESITKLRAYKDGLLKYDLKTFKEYGKVFPVGDHSEAYNRQICLANDYPKESLCYPYNPITVLGVQVLLVTYYRLHNLIAKQLRKINPCWNDDLLFNTAKDINIAIHAQIYFYELLPIVHGKSNLIKKGVIADSPGFRDVFDEDVEPQISEEFIYVQRWTTLLLNLL